MNNVYAWTVAAAASIPLQHTVVGPPFNVLISQKYKSISQRTTPGCSNQIKSNQIKLECGPMPNLMVALPNIGGAPCSTPESFADAHY